MIDASSVGNLAMMTSQVNLYLCLAALCGIVRGFPSEEILNLEEPFDDPYYATTIRNVEELVTDTNMVESSDTPIYTTELSNTPSINEAKVEKPVNELFPHAVLFGGTCGGTIISPTWILTAAHCSIGSSGRYVLAGTNNTADDSGTFRLVKRKVIHPLFLVGPYWLNAREYHLRQVRARFDFLLVELEEPLPLDDVTMKAAVLNKTYKLAPRTNVSFAGYGADYHGGFMKRDMHARNFELLPVEECARIKGFNRLDMICAKGLPPNPDFACNGDSGSGLVDDNGVLVGVTSWVEDDAIECRNGAIVYFAKVAAVRRWIHEVTNV